jgi:hypothetical protein
LALGRERDTNRDGKSDLIWQESGGTFGVWEMNGTTPIAEVGLTNPGPTWKVVGAADFNGDGRDDILLQNSTNGNLIVDLMNGSITSSVTISVGDPSWHAVSTGVFNGVTEIAWQNTNGTAGQVAHCLCGPRDRAQPKHRVAGPTLVVIIYFYSGFRARGKVDRPAVCSA